ncbi:MAG TPA: Spy/CpxP family protein refolding chaperone [Candidatus Krumholzibacteria bacterium]|nr:Spy/CpxP family protein refolding chaperone [Candidatus Krumholzibacteria bacterium]HRX50778.1 Spy/CpxP family protein refolding chaperone [Candidatus Krumholzibacteria bacterium]
MKTLKITLPLALLVLMLALPAAARPGGGPGRDADGPGDGLGPRLEKVLNLTEDQSAALAALREKHRGQAVAQRKELMKLRHQIDGLLLEDAPDAGALEKLIRRAGDLKTEMKVQGMKHRLEMRKLLTPEQRDQLLLMKPGKDGRAPRGSRPGGQACDNQGKPGGRGR